MTRYQVDDLQACEPDQLSTVAGITITRDPELDSMGFDRVTVEGPSPHAVRVYVRDNWGDDDPQWFADHVVARITPVPDSLDRPGQMRDSLMELVDSAWYDRAKGELAIGPESGSDCDEPLEDLIVSLYRDSRGYVDSVDADWNDVAAGETVTDAHIAARIAAALDILWFGEAR